MVRVVREDVVHHLPLDHGVGVAAHARVEEEVLDVLEPAGRLVEVVLGKARAEDAPRDGDLGELGRQDAAVVLERQVHLGHAERLARGAPVEDDVLHRVAAQLLRALLAEHPADGVGDVRLAAAVRSDDAGDAVAERQVGAVAERLESLDFELVEEHPCTPRVRRGGPAGGTKGPRAGERTRWGAWDGSFPTLDLARAPPAGSRPATDVRVPRPRCLVWLRARCLWGRSPKA